MPDEAISDWGDITGAPNEDWQWVPCGLDGCGICEGLRRDYPDRETEAVNDAGSPNTGG